MIPGQPSVKQRLHTFLMLFFLIVPFHVFQTPIAPPYKARARSDDIKVVFTGIEINLIFLPWSVADNGVEMFDREDDYSVVVNRCLEFVDLRFSTETLLDTCLLMPLLRE